MNRRNVLRIAVRIICSFNEKKLKRLNRVVYWATYKKVIFILEGDSRKRIYFMLDGL